MSRTSVVLALDLGTSSVKAMAVTADGAIAGSASAAYPTARPEPGAAEQNPRDWHAAVGKAVATLGPKTFHIEAIAVTGQMHGTVLLDAEGQAIAPAIIWADQRSASDAAALNVAEHGGLPSIAGSPAASGFQAATICWLRHTWPDMWARTRHVLLPKDALIRWLCGALVSDPSDAAGTWLLDSSKEAWSPDLCAAAGVERGQLPRLIRPGTIAGGLRSEIAAHLGLPVGIPVVIGGGDAPCASLGAGIVDGTEALVMLSTGAQVIRPAPRYEPPTDGLHVWPAALPESGHWNRMGATLNAGVAIEWLKRLLGADDIERLAAASSDPRPPLFFPWLSGERDPAIGTDARAAFFGLTAAHGPADLAYAVLEGIAFSLVTTFDHVRDTSVGPDKVLVAGGGSRLPTLVRLIATALDRPLTPCPMPDLSALGAAMLGAHTTGWIALPTDAKRWREEGQPVPPDATMRERVQMRLGIARDLHRAIQPLQRRLAMTGIDRSTGGAANR